MNEKEIDNFKKVVKIKYGMDILVNKDIIVNKCFVHNIYKHKEILNNLYFDILYHFKELSYDEINKNSIIKYTSDTDSRFTINVLLQECSNFHKIITENISFIEKKFLLFLFIEDIIDVFKKHNKWIGVYEYDKN